MLHLSDEWDKLSFLIGVYFLYDGQREKWEKELVLLLEFTCQFVLLTSSKAHPCQFWWGFVSLISALHYSYYFHVFANQPEDGNMGFFCLGCCLCPNLQSKSSQVCYKLEESGTSQCIQLNKTLQSVHIAVILRYLGKDNLTKKVWSCLKLINENEPWDIAFK